MLQATGNVTPKLYCSLTRSTYALTLTASDKIRTVIISIVPTSTSALHSQRVSAYSSLPPSSARTINQTSSKLTNNP
jgi:hypothetical protein